MTHKHDTHDAMSGLLLALILADFQSVFPGQAYNACPPEPKLPPHPPVPGGYDHWEYRGLGWKSDEKALYATLPVDDMDRPGGWDMRPFELHTGACRDLHYLEAVKAPVKAPEIKLPPHPPVPEGYDHW